MARPKNPTTDCTGPKCDRPAYRSGLCSGHYSQRMRKQSLRPLRDRSAGPMVRVSLRVPADVRERALSDGDGARAALMEWARK